VEASELRIIIEGIIFASSEPVSEGRIADIVSIAEKAEVRSALIDLVEHFRSSGHGFELVEVAGGYQFQTRSELAPWVRRLRPKRQWRLSRPALETLAIIAYRQPVTRLEMESIRGVDCGGVVHTLMAYQLIRMLGRKDAPGRPILYGTTKKFLETFNLKNLSALPSLREIDEIVGEPEIQEELREMAEVAEEQALAESAPEQEGREAPAPEGGTEDEEAPEADVNEDENKVERAGQVGEEEASHEEPEGSSGPDERSGDAQDTH